MARLAAIAAFVVLAMAGGATAARRDAGPTPPPGDHFLTPAMIAKLHAKTGKVTSSKPVAERPAPKRGKGAHAAKNTATDPGEALTLANAMEHTGSTFVTGASFVTVPPDGTPDLTSDEVGVSAPGFPTDGSNYAILTTGDANLAGTPNTAPDSGTDDGADPATVGANRTTAHDVTILKIAMTVPTGMNCLSFDFRFLSEEYPEYVNTEYNDAFLAELDKSTWTAASSAISAPANFAFDPSHNVVSINAAGNTSMTAGLATGTTYDGATPLLTASTPITAGTHNLFISIFDQGDHIYDSAAFVDNLRLAKAVTGQCGAGSVVDDPPADLALTKQGQVDGNTITYTLSVTNNGPNPASNVSILDVLPDGVSIGTLDDGCTDNGDNTVTCTIGSLANGDTVTKTISVTADDGDYYNSAVVTSSTFDPLLQNNSASATNDVGGTGGGTTDLQLVKIGPGSANQGDFVEYQLTVTNNGPDDSTGGFTITDTLPANQYYDGWTAEGFPDGFDGCTSGAGGGPPNVVTCTFAPPFVLANGDSFEVDLFLYMTSTGTNVTNSATVTPTADFDPDLTNNFSSTTMTSVGQAPHPPTDISITKTVDKLLQVPGGNLVYTVKVTNNGKATANGVEVEDFGDSDNTTDVSVSDTLGGCTTIGAGPFGSGFDCTISLGAGKTDVFTYTVTIDDAPGPSIFNEANAFLSSTYFDPKPANNFAFVYSQVGEGTAKAADLEAILTLPPSSDEGALQKAVVKIVNHGPQAVTLTAAGVDFTSILDGDGTLGTLPTACGLDGETVYCNAGTLVSGGSKSFTIPFSAPGAPDNYTVDGFVFSDDPQWVDPNNENNDDAQFMMVSAVSSDVSITKTASPEPVLNGASLTYTLTASNAGPDPAPNTQVVDDLPDGVTVTSISGAKCSGTSVINCNLGTLTVGKPVKITIGVTVNDENTLPDSIENDATISSSNNDPNLDNNSASATSTVNPPMANLSVTKTAKPSPVLNHGKLTYTVKVANAGPQTATNVAVEDDLPTGETLVSAKLPGSTCTGTTTILCPIASLAKGKAATLTIVVTVSVDTPPVSVENVATVDADQVDPDTSDNSATLDTTVNPPNADMGVSAKVAPLVVKKGSKATYTFTLKNNGPLNATGAQLTVAFTGGITLPATVPLGCVKNDASHVTCSGYAINAGASKVITIVVTAPNTDGTTLEADAAVSSAVTDLNAANNTASATAHTPAP
jgi:uncharacterized repeat protein (TIGR01451 family)